VGIENVEALAGGEEESKVERETDQEEYDRKEKEKDAARRERQVRLGHVPNPEKAEEEKSETESST